MRKLYSKGISLLLVLVFLLSICVPASATMISTRASNYLNKYDGVVTREGGGTIKISFTNDYSYANYVLYNGVAGTVYRAEITVFGNTDSRTFITASQKA